MSSQTNTAVAAPAPLTDEQVARFLERNPDFLSRNPDLLETLEIHHLSLIHISEPTRPY